MKYAIISDIHGNIIALQEAFKLIEKENVEKIICLGDVIGIGTRSEDCINLLKKFEAKLVYVRGNHEDRFLFGVPEYIHDGRHKMTEDDIEQEHWIRDHLSKESRDFIEKFEQEAVIELEGIKVAVTHYPSDEKMDYVRFNYFPSKEEFGEMFKKYNATINLYGHTHEARVRATEDGKWYINPGTLGTTDYKDFGTFGILTIDNGKIFYVEKAFYYDLATYLKDFDVVKPPKKDDFRDKFFGYKR